MFYFFFSSIVDSDIKYTFSISDQQTKRSMHYLSLSSVLRHLALIEGVITLPLTYPMGCQEVYLQVLFRLEPLATHLTQLPAECRRMDISDVLLQVAVVGVDFPTLRTDGLVGGWFRSSCLPQPASRPWNHPPLSATSHHTPLTTTSTSLHRTTCTHSKQH